MKRHKMRPGERLNGDTAKELRQGDILRAVAGPYQGALFFVQFGASHLSPAVIMYSELLTRPKNFKILRFVDRANPKQPADLLGKLHDARMSARALRKQLRDLGETPVDRVKK